MIGEDEEVEQQFGEHLLADNRQVFAKDFLKNLVIESVDSLGRTSLRQVINQNATGSGSR